MELKKLSVISLGGAIGSLARWGISLLIVDQSFPWATLSVNFVGAVLLTVILVYTKHHENSAWWWRPALGTGFCGGFTTYSAFALQLDRDFSAHNYHAILTYTIASLVGTFILVFVTNEILEKRWSEQ